MKQLTAPQWTDSFENRIVLSVNIDFINYLYELDLVNDSVPKVNPMFVTTKEISGKDLIGTSPILLSLPIMQKARTVTEIPVNYSPSEYAHVLTLEKYRSLAGEPRTYRVFEEKEFANIFQ